MARATLLLVLILATVLVMLSCSTTTRAALADDEKDCADQLQNLAECIPYVSGTAKKPTPACCADAERVQSSKPKCLCVLIMESTDTSLALPINTTLALQMPAACNSDAKVSDCPTILKFSPDSPEAKIFKDLSGSDSSKATTPASSSSSSPSDSTPSSAEESSSKVASNNSVGRSESFRAAVLMVSVAVIFMWSPVLNACSPLMHHLGVL